MYSVSNTVKIELTTRLKNKLTCDVQQCGILTSADSDKPDQPPVKLRHSK